MSKRSQSRSLWPLLLIVIGGLLLLGAVGWYYFFANPAPLAEESVSEPSQPYPEVERIDPAEAKAAFEAGSAVFLDVRDSDAYAQRHIPGALLIPLSEVPERLGELDPNAWIITYCT